MIQYLFNWFVFIIEDISIASYVEDNKLYINVNNINAQQTHSLVATLW